MVKNTKGGSGHKSLARKNVSSSSSILPSPSDPSECYAIVTKLFGNGMCLVSAFIHNSVISITCHIRGKFRSRNKSSNLITLHSLLLIGLRTWETSPKNSDLIFIFDDHSSIPSHILSSLYSHSSSSSSSYFDHSSSIDHSILDPSTIDTSLLDYSLIDPSSSFTSSLDLFDI